MIFNGFHSNNRLYVSLISYGNISKCSYGLFIPSSGESLHFLDKISFSFFFFLVLNSLFVIFKGFLSNTQVVCFVDFVWECFKHLAISWSWKRGIQSSLTNGTTVIKWRCFTAYRMMETYDVHCHGDSRNLGHCWASCGAGSCVEQIKLSSWRRPYACAIRFYFRQR